MLLLLAVTIPLGLDLYMPVPEEGATLTLTETAQTRHEPGTRRV